jgi:very-short-patch-repair endonuclease
MWSSGIGSLKAPGTKRRRAGTVATCIATFVYRAWNVIVELDGPEAHPPDGAFRNMRRDNDSAVAGDTTLRYGWRDVVGDPCGVAAQVGAVLSLGGWVGRPRQCGPACTVKRLA